MDVVPKNRATASSRRDNCNHRLFPPSCGVHDSVERGYYSNCGPRSIFLNRQSKLFSSINLKIRFIIHLFLVSITTHNNWLIGKTQLCFHRQLLRVRLHLLTNDAHLSFSLLSTLVAETNRTDSLSVAENSIGCESATVRQISIETDIKTDREVDRHIGNRRETQKQTYDWTLKLRLDTDIDRL